LFKQLFKDNNYFGPQKFIFVLSGVEGYLAEAEDT